MSDRSDSIIKSDLLKEKLYFISPSYPLTC